MLRLITIVLLLASLRLLAQDVSVTGNVRSLNNRPVAGVNVIVKGTSNATVTDMNGDFRLEIPEGSAVLIFSFKKQRTVEHTLHPRSGFQYQVNVVMANKSQTFNKSVATSGALSLDAPLMQGKVLDQARTPLTGVRIKQNNSAFETITDPEGNFTLPLADGKNVVTFQYPGAKDLHFEIESKAKTRYEVEAVLIEDKREYRVQESSARITLQNRL